ncbi:conserved hypothetical protein [Paraburkholderia piptadeniae]|uniref:Uncharacterized protein n=1 Tax=Paraburkholderia piptadeniae TaxID=1701573 RepID=A0A1N7SEK4_9BURK|nr:hypothetical protein [Paraburkholderia piptadeniae]SIT45801.1 conserved hypothetical protein [Paraburkholderia piptadeniae]
MNFALLLSQLPHVQESRAHYNAMLSLGAHKPKRAAAFWRSLKALVS